MALPVPNGNLDGSATFGGNEDDSFTIPAGRTASVWYGASSVRWVRLDGMSGTVTLNNATFGDVAPFTAKSGYYLLDPDGSGGTLSMTISTDPFGQSTCVASENETYTNASAYSAWYGASSNNLVRVDNVTGLTTFSNAAFGGDPAGGVAKYGFVLVGAPSGITDPYEVNVNTDGLNTWAIFSSGTSGAANQRKASSDSDNKISDLGTNISTGTTYLAARTSTDLIKAIWTGGTPTSSGNTVGMVGNTYNQVDNRAWAIGVAQDFLADTTERTAKLYIVAKGTMRVSAVLSDGAADAVVQTYKTNAATTALSGEGAYIRTLFIVTIVYKAASAGQTLRVKVTAAEEANSDNRSEMYLPVSTLTDNSASPTIIDLTAATFSTSAKTTQNRLTATPTAATLSWSGKAAQFRLTAALAAAVFSWSAKAVQNRLVATVTAATFSWSAKAIELANLTGTFIFDLTAAVFSWSAKAVQNKLTATTTAATFSWSAKTVQNRLTAALTAAQLSWSAKTVQNRLTATLTAAQIRLTGLAISARLAVSLTAATMASWSAKAVQNRLTVALTRATLNLQSLAIDFVSDAIVDVARRFRSRYSRYRKLLKQRRF